MKLLITAMVGVFVLSQSPAQANPNPLYQLHQSADRLEKLAEVLEREVSRRYRSSVVRRPADDFEDAADEFLDTIEDQDYRDLQRDHQRLQATFLQLQSAYQRCPSVPRDVYFQNLWGQIVQELRRVDYLLAQALQPNRNQYQPRYQQPRVPNYQNQPYSSPNRYPNQQIPQTHYPYNGYRAPVNVPQNNYRGPQRGYPNGQQNYNPYNRNRGQGSNYPNGYQPRPRY